MVKGEDVVRYHLVNWETCSKPKREEGLGLGLGKVAFKNIALMKNGCGISHLALRVMSRMLGKVGLSLTRVLGISFLRPFSISFLQVTFN